MAISDDDGKTWYASKPLLGFGAQRFLPRLRGADLRGADLRGAYLGGANLRGADLGGAYLGGVIERAGNLLPSQGPITAFVFLNTLQALEDEGLVTFESVDGRKTASVTDAGREWLSEHTAETVRTAMTTKIKTLPEHLVRSITWDQGSEMAQHATFTVDTGMCNVWAARCACDASLQTAEPK